MTRVLPTRWRNALAGFYSRLRGEPFRLPADIHPDFARVLKKLSKKDIAVDCGANVGRFTEMMVRTGATVYAFEPNPEAFAVLSQKFVGIDNAICLQKAIGTENTRARLYLHEHAGKDPIH